MEIKHYHSLASVPHPKPCVYSPRTHFFYLGLVVIGVITFFVTLMGDAPRAWHNYLLNFFFWTSLSLSGLFFIALQYITSSVWSTPLRRVPEAFVSFLPLSFLLMLILFAGLHSLYEWTHVEEVLKDPILIKKVAYLNVPFFVFRNIFSFLLWGGASFWFLKNSLQQDKNGSLHFTKRNRNFSAPFLVLFGLTFTLFSFDWLMSLEPHWFSTIFGVYCFSGLFYSGMALTLIFVIFLKKQGVLAPYINENHLHDLGKLMFAFCVFWAYIAFSQYMLIWYGNLPEETPYLIRRTEGFWTPVALLLLFGKFILPFFLLISRSAKRRENFLLFVSFWVLATQWLDCYWMIFPLLNDRPVFGWQEIGMFVGFLGLFVLTVILVLQRIPLVPMRDPRLLEGLNHHQ